MYKYFKSLFIIKIVNPSSSFVKKKNLNEVKTFVVLKNASPMGKKGIVCPNL
jgi:hypothetical protein